MMSGFLTGPELSRDAVNGGLALGDVVAAHAPRRAANEATAKMTVVSLSSLFFMQGRYATWADPRHCAGGRCFSTAPEATLVPSFEVV